MNKKKLEIGSSHIWKNSESGNLVKCGKSVANFEQSQILAQDDPGVVPIMFGKPLER